MEKEFNVIIHDINSKEFKSYNIIPYLLRCYKESMNKPKIFDDFKEFITKNSMYQWWSRCEYEIILGPWPYTSSPSERYDKKGENDIEAWKEHWKKHLNECEKIDVHYQVMINIDVITNLFMDIVNEENRK